MFTKLGVALEQETSSKLSGLHPERLLAPYPVHSGESKNLGDTQNNI